MRVLRVIIRSNIFAIRNILNFIKHMKNKNLIPLRAGIETYRPFIKK